MFSISARYHVTESVTALKFFKMICMARKCFFILVYFLTFCSEVVPALVPCALIKRGNGIIFSLNFKKNGYTNHDRRHEGLKLGPSLLFELISIKG